MWGSSQHPLKILIRLFKVLLWRETWPHVEPPGKTKPTFSCGESDISGLEAFALVFGRQ